MSRRKIAVILAIALLVIIGAAAVMIQTNYNLHADEIRGETSYYATVNASNSTFAASTESP